MEPNLPINSNLITENSNNLTSSPLNLFNDTHSQHVNPEKTTANPEQQIIYETSLNQSQSSSPLSTYSSKVNLCKQNSNASYSYNENNSFHHLNSDLYSNSRNNVFVQPYNSCFQTNLQPIFDNTSLNQEYAPNNLVNQVNNNSNYSYSQLNYNTNLNSFSMISKNGALSYEVLPEKMNKQMNNFVKTQRITNNSNSLHQYNISIHNTQECLSTNNIQTETTNNNLNLQLSNKKRKKELNNSSKSSSDELLITLTHLNKQIKQERNDCKQFMHKYNSKELCLNDHISSINYESYGQQIELNEPATVNNCSSSGISDNFFQSIKFYPFQQNNWHSLYNENFNKINVPKFEVYADKGFNYSNIDDVFVCQKKNHFQLTVHIHPIKIEDCNLNKQFKLNNTLDENKVYIKVETDLNVNNSNEYMKVEDFYLHFYGVKVESLNQIIRIEQSQSDRSKKLFNPIKLNILNNQICKTTVGRLHFSETTANNMRKKGKPNPDQKYFYLVASLCASADKMNYVIISHASERIIVRASNPGQFENDLKSCWQRSHFVSEAVYHNGKVGINTDDPEEALVVYGNLKLTGDLIQPSDYRIKKNLNLINTTSSLNNISKLNIYSFNYENIYEKKYKNDSLNQIEIGVLAQEVAKLIPDAVKNCGTLKLDQNKQIDNFLTIKKDRIFMEGVAAIQELNYLTKRVVKRIEKLEQTIATIKTKTHLISPTRFYNLTFLIIFIVFIFPLLKFTDILNEIFV